MQKILLILGLGIWAFGIGLSDLTAQPPVDEDQYEKAYQKRIKKDYLYGVYIPKDMADAFTELNKKIDESSKRKFLAIPDTMAARKLHFSLGRWLIHNWGFYRGSRYSAYLKGINIHHPDDMASFTIVAYHRYLTKTPLDIKNLITYFVERREAIKKQRLLQGKVLHEETRQRTEPPSDDGKQ